MNAIEIINFTLSKYKLDPSNPHYLVIVDAMQKYQANPPDIINNDMRDAKYRSKYENLTTNKQFDFEKDRLISLDDLFYKFIRCPNGITSENFKQALTEYENEFIKNTNIIDPFDI
ncbi:MAG: hypothetical protein RMZ42_32295 [Nostoc sp. DedQUE05]|uniref:hypothetical protein n=1 Tax=Nostoc sp. DedQUE05 TaxID=3075391 RepID=UPI002AD358A0|nr:hypothetical protein [Nostoc sp. DedQUE05]MDZ8096586.1 hypothetical protein [Nostoc sp. DedQUE05]